MFATNVKPLLTCTKFYNGSDGYKFDGDRQPWRMGSSSGLRESALENVLQSKVLAGYCKTSMGNIMEMLLPVSMVRCSSTLPTMNGFSAPCTTLVSNPQLGSSFALVVSLILLSCSFFQQVNCFRDWEDLQKFLLVGLLCLFDFMYSISASCLHTVPIPPGHRYSLQKAWSFSAAFTVYNHFHSRGTLNGLVLHVVCLPTNRTLAWFCRIFSSSCPHQSTSQWADPSPLIPTSLVLHPDRSVTPVTHELTKRLLSLSGSVPELDSMELCLVRCPKTIL